LLNKILNYNENNIMSLEDFTSLSSGFYKSMQIENYKSKINLPLFLIIVLFLIIISVLGFFIFIKRSRS